MTEKGRPGACKFSTGSDYTLYTRVPIFTDFLIHRHVTTVKMTIYFIFEIILTQWLRGKSMLSLLSM